ncbi:MULTISPECIES: hypothetical protein [Vibrio]|uniref:hypothetical protein n=1 Tax=Vibrio TaxID=662 RepID=UPI0020766135|nr:MULTISPECIES: hypothetical protein [Vibrio]USD35536.1 hypothetical protein J8Z27_23235 [Vibrio sp. SCSIO 43186]USD72660.1 hypothetical protein J4N41_23240 [Vibrio sp. SCSIO 43139]USD98874.1 hypothetical protein CTT30_22595 [Vibrio coralliilyticus]
MTTKPNSELYHSHILSIAELYVDSVITNVSFRGDLATVYALIIKGRAWGIQPDYMVSNSFIDTYGKLDHTGSIYRMAIYNNCEVKDVQLTEEGPWSKVHNCFKKEVVHHTSETNFVPLWERDIESSLGLTIQVDFNDPNRKPMIKTMFLSEIDISRRSEDSTWVTGPKRRLENLMYRDLAHHQFFELVHSYELEGSILDTRRSEDVTVSTVENADINEDCISQQVDNPTSTDWIKQAVDLQTNAINAQLQGDVSGLTEAKHKLVQLVSNMSNVSESEVNTIRKIYNETKNIVIEGDQGLLSSIPSH